MCGFLTVLTVPEQRWWTLTALKYKKGVCVCVCEDAKCHRSLLAFARGTFYGIARVASGRGCGRRLSSVEKGGVGREKRGQWGQTREREERAKRRRTRPPPTLSLVLVASQWLQLATPLSDRILDREETTNEDAFHITEEEISESPLLVLTATVENSFGSNESFRVLGFCLFHLARGAWEAERARETEREKERSEESVFAESWMVAVATGSMVLNMRTWNNQGKKVLRSLSTRGCSLYFLHSLVAREQGKCPTYGVADGMLGGAFGFADCRLFLLRESRKRKGAHFRPNGLAGREESFFSFERSLP